MVVSRIKQFDNKVGELRTHGGETGYLLVRIQDQPWSDGNTDLGVDLSVDLFDGRNWTFSDRADPDPDDALVELESGILEWFGNRIPIVRWLNEQEGRDVIRDHFA